eukprot:622619-Prymnesium_polylepis.1
MVSVYVGRGDHQLQGPLVIDANVTSSEIVIQGDGATLQSAAGGPAFVIRAGAPRVRLTDLRLDDSVAISIEGGDVTIDGCHFDGAAATGREGNGRALTEDDGRPAHALKVQGGRVRVKGVTFSALRGGAALVTAGELLVDNCTFQGNAADMGGAVLITGGSARITRTQFSRNRAQTSGGALQVDGGACVLADGTQFLDNRAPLGSSLQFSGGVLNYELPSPLAHW